MLSRVSCFVGNVISASWDCELDALPIAVLITIFAGLIWLACEMVLEGDTADVRARLAALSINPNHWTV